VFAEHHMPLYDEGIRALNPDDPGNLHVVCAQLCRGIYAYPTDPPMTWNHRENTAGIEWGIKYDGQRAYAVFRGSDSILDWIRDLVGFAPSVSTENFGQMWGGFIIGMEYAWGVIAPLVKGYDEIVFTGHSLGAARADIAAGYAIQAI
jgi:hypothetical protein